MNIGPEVEQKLVILKASFLEIFPDVYRSAVILAPIGYPDIELIKNTYAEIGGVLKSFWQGFLNIKEIFSVIPVNDNILVKKIKGKTLGNTFNAHALIPSNVFCIYSDGEIIIHARI